MEHWLAGLTAAAAAWLINRYLVSRGGDKAVIWFVPPLEEVLKTGSSLLIGASIPLAHGVFGLLEAVHDYLASPRWGLWAGLSSIATHYFLGIWTVLFYNYYSSWFWAILSASLLHTLWNLIMVDFFSRLLKRQKT